MRSWMCTESFWTPGCVSASEIERGVGKVRNWVCDSCIRAPDSTYTKLHNPTAPLKRASRIFGIEGLVGSDSFKKLPIQDPIEAPTLSVEVASSSRNRSPPISDCTIVRSLPPPKPCDPVLNCYRSRRVPCWIACFGGLFPKGAIMNQQKASHRWTTKPSTGISENGQAMPEPNISVSGEVMAEHPPDYWP